MSKLFTVVGIDNKLPNGMVVRFANDLATHAKATMRSGCTRFDYIELDHPMSKYDACIVLRNHSAFQSDADQKIIQHAINKHKPEIETNMEMVALLREVLSELKTS